MKFGVSAAAALSVLAVAGVWAWTTYSPQRERLPKEQSLGPVGLARVEVTPPPQQLEPPGSIDGRVVLTPQQQAQARGSGTLDRPVVSLLTVNAPMHFGDYVWNDKSVPAGPTWIRVDLRSQLISVFRAGQEIGTAVIVYGGENKVTPQGVLHILGKSKDHRSSIYDASMPYTLRLTGDGVSIHGSSVRYGAATHGCIGVPINFARELFAATKVGDEVVIVSPPHVSS